MIGRRILWGLTASPCLLVVLTSSLDFRFDASTYGARAVRGADEPDPSRVLAPAGG
jgi:hypothetical protein